eukprot:NODE_3194_length_1026_cov_50.202661_g2936_i0.p1 GENE.NODE_3194_length_1026_cov_50.202661_g2936_i0~~NODE_3194_length_1026_cov_50.202661_g2936_i0.p1  ORF type:complete len:223 (-),score=38.54 NODE_3194_length_1026_cov_50.202661_g2936_i0:356-937(-)
MPRHFPYTRNTSQIGAIAVKNQYSRALESGWFDERAARGPVPPTTTCDFSTTSGSTYGAEAQRPKTAPMVVPGELSHGQANLLLSHGRDTQRRHLVSTNQASYTPFSSDHTAGPVRSELVSRKRRAWTEEHCTVRYTTTKDETDAAVAVAAKSDSAGNRREPFGVLRQSNNQRRWGECTKDMSSDYHKMGLRK